MFTKTDPGRRLDHDRGFTLLEVLVALAVLTIALAAIIKATANQSINAGYLRDKTLAHWVAMNQIADQQLNQTWPSPGKADGSEEMGLHLWYWQRIITSTPDDRVRRIQVNVFREENDESPITQLVSFLAQPK
jgi:general secretion pathway protein I